LIKRGNETVHSMDVLGRVIRTDRIDQTNNQTITTTTDYEYNSDPFQTRVVDFNGKPTVYKNEGCGLLHQVTQWVNGQAEVTSFSSTSKG
jgi:hypothetical protein